MTIPLLDRLRGELAGALAAACGVTLFVNIATLFVPIYDMILYDRVLQSKNMDTVTVLTVGVVAGMTIYGLLEFCRSAIFLVAADRLARRLNLPALQAAISQSLEGEHTAAGQAMRDLNELRLFAAGPSAAIPLDLLWTPILSAILFLLHPAYGAYAVICACILFCLSLLTDLMTRDDLLAANEATAASLNDLSTALRNRELLDGMGMLPDIVRRWKHRQGTTLDILGAANRRNKGFAAAARTARLTMQGGVIALGAVLVMRNQASPGSMMGATLLVARLLLPFEQLVAGWRQWISALAAWRRTATLLGHAERRRSGRLPARIEGRLVVDNVKWSPPHLGRNIVDGLSFVLDPGEAVAVVGPSGSGKSTLARLVMGVFRPSDGEIRLDGVPTWDWDRAAFGRHVGYLPQAISLLDGTILDNIARLQSDDPEPAIEAAAKAGIHDLIGRLPEGYGTWIGGAGPTLSGGQRQRIALARALYGSPRLLVLDEPNSNLDHGGELALLQAIERAKAEGCAVMLVTHLPRILAVADRIIQLKDGRESTACLN